MTDQSSYCENPSVLEYVLPKKIMLKEGKKEKYYSLKAYHQENWHVYFYANNNDDIAFKPGVGSFYSAGRDNHTALYKMREFMYNYEKEMKKKRNK